MKVDIDQAIATFFPNPSYEMVYTEAIANAIDAGATEITISISIESFTKPDTLQVTIQDNGCGFSNERFEQFSKLLNAQSKDHKGLGRLVFLCYFNQINFESTYTGKKRCFCFDRNFDGASTEDENKNAVQSSHGTIIKFRSFKGKQLKSYANLVPDKIIKSVVSHFWPLLFQKNKLGQELSIEVKLETCEEKPEHQFINSSSYFTLRNLPKLEIATVDADLVSPVHIHYSIVEDKTKHRSISASICVDGRTVPYEIMPEEAIPHGYQIQILLESEIFIGKTNPSRQSLELSNDIDENILKKKVQKKVNELLIEKIPAIKSKNEIVYKEIDITYPHYAGFYNRDDVIGLAVKQNIISDAQKVFFEQEKKILECEELDDNLYHKALEFSSRTLTEYVLYRSKIIEKLKKIDNKCSEGFIHDIILPKNKVCKSDEFIENIFTNNIWLLDDKYMSYSSTLSDLEMTTLIRHIAGEEVKSSGRPDIAIVFSSNPNSGHKVDLVIVELKKLGISLAKQEEVISQLKQRARKLLDYYNDKIERIWFYGIAEIDDELERSLKEDDYIEVFSRGKSYYKQVKIITDKKREYYVDLCVMNYDAFVNDAESRNTNFLSILKQRIKEAFPRHIN